MNPNLNKMAQAAVAPKLLKGFRLSWLAYGAIAYFGLKYLNKKGIMTKQTGAALGLIDKGVSYAKGQMGWGEANSGISRYADKSNAQTSMRH